MYITQNNERLYLRTWEYNAARILTELANIVKSYNGKVKPLKNALISNRTLDKIKRELQDSIETNMKYLASNPENTPLEIRLKENKRKLAELESINNDPIQVTHTTYITFAYNEYIYSFSVNDNPFFPFYFSKTEIKNGKYSLDVYSSEDDKLWMHDDLFSYFCTDMRIKETANIIFQKLISSRPSEHHVITKRKLVPNLYDNGYHYENVREKERIAIIDF